MDTIPVELVPPSLETVGAWLDAVILVAVALTVALFLAADIVASMFGVHRQ